jgi:hypothetical protein
VGLYLRALPQAALNKIGADLLAELTPDLLLARTKPTHLCHLLARERPKDIRIRLVEILIESPASGKEAGVLAKGMEALGRPIE